MGCGGGWVIGFCDLRRLDAYVAWTMRPGWRFPTVSHRRTGRGLATEVAFAVLRYGFEEAGLDRILGIQDKENAASRRVLEKIEMTFEGKPSTKAA